MKLNKILLLLPALVLLGCGEKDQFKPVRKNIVDAVFASGHTENFDQYTVMANAEGFVQKAYVLEGDSVKTGQSLFRILNNVQQTQVNNAATNLAFARSNAIEGSPQITQLEIQIAQARKKLTVDSANYERYARLVKSKAVSQSDYENAQLTAKNSLSALQELQKNLADLKRNLNLNVANAKAQLDEQAANNDFYELKSQATGVVMNVSKKTGDYVKKGDAIAILGTGPVIIKLDIAEDDIRRVKLGQKTEILLNSEKDVTYSAKITKIYPSFDATDQSFIVEATFDKLPDHLLNGTQVQANIIVQTKSNALVIPSYYLINNNYVQEKGEKDKTQVNTGISTLEWTEIISGIDEHSTLVPPKK